MSEETKTDSPVDWIFSQLPDEYTTTTHGFDVYIIAKAMEKEQIGYTKADVIKAGEMGEINYLDTLHITTYLDEAKKFNETYGGNK